ncbi:uncharacterized protein LOC124693480 isoform X2 [Lolium rigidum]|uniref:uncharacterized protein LOC124693480 isoform X1 n=1 Tax=Lolium rigidum TaxID=89674 RepID=UPI001F5D5B08|nr:uncharacterized protein LOC124693480 isoform X1 [Lolium rigidum]XP_047082909.1 uncharacterized protein LOC124693480 isoform X2 [Lolium rigidum]
MAEDCGDDRISTLPNDILLNILDRLHVSDAAKTSILSRRWSQLSAKLPRLIINPLPEGVLSLFGRDESRANISDGDLARLNAATFKATKSVLARRDPGQDTIRLLSTMFYLIGDVPISIGHVVGEAMAVHQIEKAEFTILTVKGRDHCTLNDVVNYGKQFVPFFNECRNAFTRLTRLYLENLRFAESDFVSNIFVTCKLLKYLGLFNCDTDNWITLQIEHAQLRELSLVNCRFDKVELKWLPKLTRTTYKFWMSFEDLPLSFGHVPLLEFLHLTTIHFIYHKMVRLSTLLSEICVQDLRLAFKCEKIWVQPEPLTERLAAAFRGLRIVNLVLIPEGHDLTWTMFILEAAPCLEEFYMSVIDHLCEMEYHPVRRRQHLYSAEQKGVEWESPRSDFQHRRLTKLIIFCFGNYIVSHLRRVMKVAVNLMDVYLYDRVACRYCKHINPLNPGRLPRNKKKLNAMRNLLTQDIQSPARIHFLTPSPEMDADHAERSPESFR